MASSNKPYPWNPQSPAKVTPKEYEVQVVSWLRTSGSELHSFEVNHLEKLTGAAGEYEFDAVAELELLQGARVKIIIECKRYGRPVEREKLLALWAKLQDVKGHKAMIFSTSGFQRGAIDYASAYGIATVSFVEGKFLYHTRDGSGFDREPPAWVKLPKFCGIMIQSKDEKTISAKTISDKDTSSIESWLRSVS